VLVAAYSPTKYSVELRAYVSKNCALFAKY
jgi:hypothetical protein